MANIAFLPCATYLALAFCMPCLASDVAAAETSVHGVHVVENPYWWAAELKLVAEFRSPHPRDRVSLTVVAPFSLERLQPLEFQCLLHKTSASIVLAGAVYIPVFNGKIYSKFDPDWNGRDVYETIASIRQFHEKASAIGCILDLALWQEDLPEASDWYTYPNNALRNKALDLADTEVVALIDADFIFGPTSFGDHFQPGLPMYEATMQLLRQKTVVVMPAFDCPMNHTQIDAVHRVIAGATEKKQHLFDLREIHAFQKTYHHNTNYSRWKNSSELYYVPYLMEGQEFVSGYEPYILALKKGLPCYDERFRGYFYNKCSFLYHVFRLGFQFAVHPDVYVIHYPHAKVDKIAQRDGQRRLVLMQLMSRMRDEITRKTYKPFVQDGTCNGFF